MCARWWLFCTATILVALSACRRSTPEAPIDAGPTGPWIDSPAFTGSPLCLTERACLRSCEDDRGEDCARAASFQMLRGNLDEMRILHRRACNAGAGDATACTLVDDRPRALLISERACQMGDGRACYQHGLLENPLPAQLDANDRHACGLGAAEACLATAIRNRDVALLARARRLAEDECARGDARGCLVRVRAKLDADDRDRWLARARRIYGAECKAGYLPSCRAGGAAVDADGGLDAALPE